jgi:hypothetical protein
MARQFERRRKVKKIVKLGGVLFFLGILFLIFVVIKLMQ